MSRLGEKGSANKRHSSDFFKSLLASGAACDRTNHGHTYPVRFRWLTITFPFLYCEVGLARATESLPALPVALYNFGN